MLQVLPLDIAFPYGGGQSVITPTLIRDEQDTILVDCGYPAFEARLQSALERHGLDLASVTKLIASHHDMDHIGSLAAIKRAYPGIRIIAHELEAPYIRGEQPSLRLVQAEALFDQMPEESKPGARKFMDMLRTIEPAPVDVTVADGEVLDWCGGIEIVRTPGHMPGHTSLYLPSCATLVAGDAVVIEEGRLELANPQFTLDMEEAIGSVRRLLEYEIERLICYHGGLFAGDAKEGLRLLVEKYEG